MTSTQLADQFLYQSSLKSDPEIRVSQRKRVPFVIDINQGSYSNGVVTIDATSQLNGAEGFGSLREAYLVVPYKVSMKNTHASVALGAAANRLSVGLKCGVWNVIDSLSLELNGKTIVSMTDYALFANNLRAQTEFSTGYVDKHGAESFLFPDSATSTLWSATATTSGDGFANNTTNVAGNPTTGGVLPANDGLTKRLLCNPPASAANTFGWPTIASASSSVISNQLGRGAFVAGAATAGSIAGTWHYMLKIRLVDLHPVFDQLDLMANPQIKLRIRINQGSAQITSDASSRMSLSSLTLASGNVCPIMVTSSASGSANNGVVPASGQFTVAWGCVVNSLEPTIDGTYMPFTTVRLYVPFFDLENPQALISKPEKKVRYLSYYPQWFYQRAGVGIKGDGTQFNTAFDLQLSASLKNAKFVALLPYAETSTGNFATATCQQFQSPFDSAPWTVQPGSCIRNFNIRIGSQQVFDLNHDYSWHSFINEFSKLGAINGDISEQLSNGLIDMRTWDLTNRVLIADVSRLTEKDVPQSIQIQGVNASSQGVNMLVLVAFENELTYNRLTGEVSEYVAS